MVFEMLTGVVHITWYTTSMSILKLYAVNLADSAGYRL